MFSILYISLGIIFLLSPSSYCLERIACGVPSSFQVEPENNRHIYVYDAEIKVIYDRNNLAVYSYPDSSFVNYLINDTAISFEGHIVEGNEELDPTAFRTSRVLIANIAGSGKLLDTGSKTILIDCTSFVSRNLIHEKLNIPENLEIEIIHEAASCAKSFLCERLGNIKAEDMTRAKNNPFNFGTLSAFTRVKLANDNNTKSNDHAKSRINVEDVKYLLANYDHPNNVNKGAVQTAINELVDLAIAEIVEKIREKNQGRIHIPDLSENFSTGSSWWKTTGEFNSFNGTFEDLTTLTRTEDATLSRSGLKFTASCGFGLSRAFLQYPKYKLRYGIINVDGNLSAYVDGVSLSASVGIDYNQKPCQASLQEMRVTELGKIKIKVTGLGPLNSLLSKIVTWITKKWRDDIVTFIEQKVREATVDHLDKFNCEKYRP